MTQGHLNHIYITAHMFSPLTELIKWLEALFTSCCLYEQKHFYYCSHTMCFKWGALEHSRPWPTGVVPSDLLKWKLFVRVWIWWWFSSRKTAECIHSVVLLIGRTIRLMLPSSRFTKNRSQSRLMNVFYSARSSLLPFCHKCLICRSLQKDWFSSVCTAWLDSITCPIIINQLMLCRSIGRNCKHIYLNPCGVLLIFPPFATHTPSIYYPFHKASNFCEVVLIYVRVGKTHPGDV